jgi:large subunit ribosomal protein L3
MQGLIGKKIGMTQVWDKDGVRVPVTVLEAGPCPVVQVKTVEKDGYAAVQLGWGPQKESRLSKAEVGHAKKAGVAAVRVLREFAADEGEAVEAGKVYTAKDVFEGVAFVDVIGVSKGKGFMGVMRRHGFAGGPHTHGGHVKRRPGSIGMRQTPGATEKGHPMAGDTGNRRCTVQNLKLEQVRAEKNLLLVRGAVPGPNGSMVIIRKAVKKA